MRCLAISILLAACLAADCRPQSAAPTVLPGDLARRVEVMVRVKYGLPPTSTVTIGRPESSTFKGFEKLPITIAVDGRAQIVDFLLSEDGTKLVRMETFDLNNDPIFHIDVTGRPVRGNPGAKVTVINFDDLECPFCARLYRELFPSTFERYKNQVRFIYKDYPLPQHPWAMHAAIDANCLAAQDGGAYWSFVDYLHTHVSDFSAESKNLKNTFAQLDRIAGGEGADAKLDQSALEACIAKQDESRIQASTAEAQALGVESVPAIYINGDRFNGAIPEDQVWAVIDRALRAAGEMPPPKRDRTP